MFLRDLKDLDLDSACKEWIIMDYHSDACRRLFDKQTPALA